MLVAEFVEPVGNAARETKNDELAKVFHGVIISQGGVIPDISPVLQPDHHLARSGSEWPVKTVSLVNKRTTPEKFHKSWVLLFWQ